MSASNDIFKPSAVYAVGTEMAVVQDKLEGGANTRRLLSSAFELKRLTRNLKAFVTLAKPEITLMVMISAGFACVMASDGFRVLVLLKSVLGIGLLGAGALALNQYLERELDGRMRRTSRRPLPAGDLAPRRALLFGVSLAVGGMLYLLLWVNGLTALLGVITLISYLFIYTPLKTRTPLCTLLGAFPGAAPVLMGWAAARNSLAPEAWGLFAILFLWQFPHFYAIGWLYREDYERAGMFMLPASSGDDGNTTFRLILIFTGLVIIASLSLTVIAPKGGLYFLSAVVLGLRFCSSAYGAFVSRSKLAAKRLLHASVIYLPLLYLVMVLDKFTNLL
jgi:protoheme IX farnesyltransferase